VPDGSSVVSTPCPAWEVVGSIPGNAEHWNWRTKELCKCLDPFTFPWSLRVKYPTTLVNFQKLFLPNQKILWRIIVNIMNFPKLIKLLDRYVLKWPRYYGSVVIHINYIIWVHSQLFSVFLKEPYKLGHQHFFGLPVAKWKQLSSASFHFSVYIHGSWTLGKSYEIKSSCYWEHIGNKWDKPKKLLSPHPLKKKVDC